jgi:2,3-bisphosphoglycerate-independent phosphoglycerate mutase
MSTTSQPYHPTVQRKTLVTTRIVFPSPTGHDGDVEAKVAALEHWDTRLLYGLVEYLEETGPWRLLWIADHVTATRRRRHTAAPVPYLYYDSEVSGPGGVLTESAVAHLKPDSAHMLMDRLLGRD